MRNHKKSLAKMFVKVNHYKKFKKTNKKSLKNIKKTVDFKMVLW